MEILKNKVVIVAASDQGNRDCISEEFRNAGAQVLAASGGFEAYELVRDRPVDAVVTDAQLSSGSPSQLLSDIRHLNYDIPVVLFGYIGSEFSQTEALHLGFAAYFFQNFTTHMLVAAVARSLEFVNQRKKKRVERVSVTAEVDLLFGDPIVCFRASVLNISRGGMFLSLERNFPELETVVNFKLRFLASISQPDIEGKALVRWIRERAASGHLPGLGVEFVEMSEQARSLIEAHVASHGGRR